MNSTESPRQVPESFYAAERHYMQAGGTKDGASFTDMAKTLDPNVILHQSPDLPYGGEYIGHEGYRAWADAMSAIFDRVDAQNPEFFGEERYGCDCLYFDNTRAVNRARDEAADASNGQNERRKDYRIPTVLLERA